MIAARRIFRGAAIYGLIVLLPQYFLEARIGRDSPPPITHPEYFYGFLGVTIVWQVAFWVIGGDPARYRPLMPVAMLEKLGFGPAVFVLAGLGRVDATTVAFAALDLTIGALFVVAWLRTPVEGRGDRTNAHLRGLR